MFRGMAIASLDIPAVCKSRTIGAAFKGAVMGNRVSDISVACKISRADSSYSLTALVVQIDFYDLFPCRTYAWTIDDFIASARQLVRRVNRGKP